MGRSCLAPYCDLVHMRPCAGGSWEPRPIGGANGNLNLLLDSNYSKSTPKMPFWTYYFGYGKRGEVRGASWRVEGAKRANKIMATILEIVGVQV